MNALTIEKVERVLKDLHENKPRSITIASPEELNAALDKMKIDADRQALARRLQEREQRMTNVRFRNGTTKDPNKLKAKNRKAAKAARKARRK
jgi:pantothenate kinase